ncbi:MAG: hypothetical protein PHQ43_10100, partial [Dehalococcoidales bacterium]|nr:hypothetical protein [Dehalococcoidales bacterium]
MTNEPGLCFPIQGHVACPICGAAGVGDILIRNLRAAGKISPDAFPNGLVINIPFPDIKKLVGLLVPEADIPILQIFFDVCSDPDCLTWFCRKVELTFERAQVNVKIPKAPPIK